MLQIIRHALMTSLALLAIAVGVCVTSPGSLHAQNNVLTPLSFGQPNTSVVRTPTSFLLGWNFGYPARQTMDAMQTNVQHLSFSQPLVNAVGTTLTDVVAFPSGGTAMRNFTPNIARCSTCTTYVIPSIRYELPVTLPQVGGSHSGYTLSNDNFDAAEICIGFRYEPELNMADTTDLTYTPDANASDGAIFGFRNVHTNAVRDTTRMRFNAGDFTAQTTVLSNVWPQDQLSRWVKDQDAGTDQIPDESSERMVFVVNLRRGNAAPDDNTTNQDEPVLRIRLPYRIGHGAAITNNIQFDTVPNPIVADVQLNTADASVGWMKPFMTPTSKPREIIITRRMIPSASAARRDINIVATFTCGNFAVNNPRFKQGMETDFHTGVDEARITSMDIEVDYVPSIDVAVDFVGVRTEKAHHWLCGHYDPLIIAAHDENIFQFTHFSSITGFPYNIHRFYGKNEAIPMFWEGLRYFNIRMDTLAISEVGIEWPRRFLHHTKIDRLWQGTTIRCAGNTISPTLWDGLTGALGQEAYWFNGLSNGYNALAGLGGDTPWHWNHDVSVTSYFRRDYEVLSSDRDLTISGVRTLNIDLPMDPTGVQGLDAKICTWEGVSANGNSTPLSALETVLTFQRYQGSHSYLFDPNRVWYANVWTEVQAKVENKPTDVHFTYGLNRPKTAEEIRLQTWNQVILGAKGLFYYYGPSNRPADFIVDDPDFRILIIGLTRTVEQSWFNTSGSMGTTLNSFTNASPELGYDFIPDNPSDPDNDTIIGLASCMTNASNVVDFNFFATHQKCATDRFYVGMLSSRMEAARCLTQIRTIEDSLMHLHMLAWKSVGYRRWVSGDSTLMAGYLWLDSSHQFVRPFHRMDSTGYPEHEYIDSMFYDITLHSKEGLDADSIFYVGVLNRRTNPRVKAVGTIATSNPEDSTLFFSGEEWRDLVRAGTYNRMAQLGSRLIRLPFNYTRKSGSAYNLRIKEVSWDTSVYSGPMIDTTVGGDVALEIAFQPGEGKFFRVEAIPASGFTPARGFLDHSNQRKIVAYPKAIRIDTITDVVDTNRKFIRIAVGDTIRYHCVYHRRPTVSTTETFTETGPVAVYYRRSAPVHVSKDTITGSQSYFEASMLEWEDEILLSDSLYYQVSDISLYRMGALSCAYPSLVVRTDTTTSTHAMVSRVYVVYGCEYRITTSSPWQVLVSEATLPADSSRAVQIAYHAANPPNVLASTMAPTTPLLENWGTPMINASNKGNFYCWSDAARGIGYGFKLPDQKTFAPGQWLYVRGRAGYVSSHPSLNSYSRLYLGEDDASMVWQEGKNSSSEGNFIFYTRIGHNATAPYAPYLFLNPGGSAHRQFVSAVHLDTTFNPNVAILTDTNVVLDEENVRAKHAFPVVYRHLSDWEAATTSPLYTLRPVNNVCDRVYWQTQKYYPTVGKWRITRRPIDVQEWYGINGTPDSIWTMAPHYIFDQSNHLKGPDVAQGTQWGDPSSNPVNPAPWYADSTVVLNFWSESSPSSTTPELWHMQYGWNYYGQNVDHDRADLVTVGWMKRLYEYGRYPHLAARHSYMQSKEWMRNRRIFEDDIATRPDFKWSPGIMQSSQYFYKQTANTSQPMAIRYGGFRGGDNAALFGPIMRHETGEMIPMTGEDTGPNDQVGQGAQHKLVSSWMDIPAVSDVSLLSMSEGTDRTANLYVERESTGELLEVEPSQTTQVGVVVPNAQNGASEILNVSQYTLLGSENERYRFVLLAERGDVYQVEDIQLVQPDEAEAFSKTLPTKSQILDLRSMKKSSIVAVNDIVVSPSPARDQVRIVVNMRADVDARNTPVETSCIITDERGVMMQRVTCNTVDVLTVQVSTWPTGVYNVRVMSQLPNGNQSVTAKSFMVLR